MTEKKLKNCKIAILATHGFEESELMVPWNHLKDQGADVSIVSLSKDPIRSWNQKEWGQAVPVDRTTQDTRPQDFDGLVLPGGVMNPDQLRMDAKAVEFVRDIAQSGKPIAAICHGPWTLIDAGVVRGRKMTSWPSLKADLTNAGAFWVDQEVVVDQGLVTSRKPADLEAFSEKMIEEFAKAHDEARPAIQQAQPMSTAESRGSFH